MNTGTTNRTRRLTAALAVTAAGIAALVAAPSALALGFGSLGTTPASTQAGANSNLAIAIGFTSAGDDVRNLTIGLPPGQIGDPNATPKCTVAELNGAGCAANTRVGSVSTGVSILGVPLTVTGDIFNLVPQPGEPARFGIKLSALPLPLPLPVGGVLPPIILQSGVSLRTTDFGLDTVINDIPNTATVLPGVDVPLDITSMNVTLFGIAGTGVPFLRNPTSCGPAVTSFQATPYTGSSATGNASYTPTGCANVPFSPEFTAKVGARGFTAPSTKPPITTSIRQTSDEAGLKDAIVFLPSVIGADLAALDANCPEAQFLAGTCPESTVIGSAIAQTPLLTTPLAGPVIVVKGADPLPRLGLDLRGELPLKLSGEFVLTGGTGVSFSDLPDIPISNFELRFKANGLSVNSTNLCAPPAPVFSTDFTAHSGATQSGPSTATVDGCTSPKAPSAKVTVKGTRSGQPSLKLKAKAGSSKLRQVKLKLPKSLSFAGSGAFENGLKAQADGRKLPAGAVANGSRKLKVTLPRGASSLVVRIAKGALRSKGARGKLRFPVKLLDADGTRTALKLRAKAK